MRCGEKTKLNEILIQKGFGIVSCLNQFIENEHPCILKEYKLFLRKDRLPAIGSTVVSKVSGYGGSAGRHLTVVEYGYKGQTSSGEAVWGEDYIVLVGGGKCLCKMDNWWKELDLIYEPIK
ncbi:hypothetical protein [Brevibacillus brevis]|uniref:hypothetical protein n=1 Tax=Brevibacillus brevis TaxID=1393 RepID=UPI0007D8B707|nr:hypothetical protein [Brevibacillus brevis]